MDLPELPLTPRQVAEAYGMSYQNIMNEIWAGRLHARKKKGSEKRWYITKDDLRDWVENSMWQ